MAEQKAKTYSEQQFVIFKLGSEEFGVNISEVREIIRMEQITRIPNTLDYIKGVINLRGGIIVIIDLSMKLCLPQKVADKNSRIIVIEFGTTTVGMIVDSATEVLRLRSDQIESAPSVITKKVNADYIQGVGIINNRLLILLNLIKVLEDNDLSKIAEVKKAAGGE